MCLVRPFERLAIVRADVFVNLVPAREVLNVGGEVRASGTACQQEMAPSRLVFHSVCEEPIQQHPLFVSPHARLEIEGSARGERDEVERAMPQLLNIPRQERDAVREAVDLLSCQIELLDVLARNAGIRADVDDVDARDASS